MAKKLGGHRQPASLDADESGIDAIGAGSAHGSDHQTLAHEVAPRIVARMDFRKGQLEGEL